MLVPGQLSLCQSKCLFTHRRRNRHFDPVRARPITMTVASVRETVPLTQWPRDALSSNAKAQINGQSREHFACRSALLCRKHTSSR
jgi:hypothetical protein